MHLSMKILVPVDGSDASARAAKFAADAARHDGAIVTVLHVYDAPAVAAMGLVALSPTDVKKAQHSLAEGAFAKATAALGDVNAETRTELGNPVHVIVSLAKEYDQIVMGSRGLSTVKELLMGSVSHSVMMLAPCPVTIVR